MDKRYEDEARANMLLCFWSGLSDRVEDLANIKSDKPSKKDRLRFDMGVKGIVLIAGVSENIAWFEVRMREGFRDPAVILDHAEEFTRRAESLFTPDKGNTKERRLLTEALWDVRDIDSWEDMYDWYEKMLKISSMLCLKYCRRAGIVEKP